MQNSLFIGPPRVPRVVVVVLPVGAGVGPPRVQGGGALPTAAPPHVAHPHWGHEWVLQQQMVTDDWQQKSAATGQQQMVTDDWQQKSRTGARPSKGDWLHRRCEYICCIFIYNYIFFYSIYIYNEYTVRIYLLQLLKWTKYIPVSEVIIEKY